MIGLAPLPVEPTLRGKDGLFEILQILSHKQCKHERLQVASTGGPGKEEVMMFGKKVLLLAATILAVSLWGCSSDFDAENNPVAGGTGTPVVDASSIGAGNCIGCHEDADLSTIDSPQIVTDYLAGGHVIHPAPTDPALTIIDAASPPECLVCHDPIGDGRSLESFIAPDGDYAPTPSAAIPLAGLAAVTCEACHGAGGDHAVNAAGLPVPYATPDYDRCGQCHNAALIKNNVHPAEGDNILEDYTASKHFSGASRNQAVCVKCHTDEGARLYKSIDTATDLANTLPVTATNKIQCRTCHDSHNNGRLLEADTLADPDPTRQASAEYNTCTNCHQRHDAQIGATITQVGAATDGASGDLIIHAASWDRVISSTHRDDPATPDFIEGYVIDPTNERACRDCHNVHGADATINKQWAASGHGGHLRTAKEAAAAVAAATPILQVAAVRAAGADGADNSLAHYDWDDTGGWNGSARGGCQMCHTATGAKNFLTDPVNYDLTGVGNNFSHLAGWVDGVSSSGQNELLYCWACHSDNSGNLRNPGAIAIRSYTVNEVNPTLPDLGKSNVCLNCHGGRGNFDSIVAAVALADADPADTINRSSRFAGHHAPAAAVLLSSVTHFGYEFAGQDYTDRSFFRHDRIGTDVSGDADAARFAGAIALVGTDTGSCVACHMAEANHTYAVVAKDVDGNVTAINNQALCDTCHDDMSPAIIDEESAGYQNASLLLKDYLANALTNYLNLDIATTSNNNYRTVPLDAYGAFQNAKLAAEEPGAFAHNRFYVKRLIFDSLDWLDNGVLDGTININSATYPAAAAWLGAAEAADPTATPPIGAAGDATRP
jgi:hypothetical protein